MNRIERFFIGLVAKFTPVALALMPVGHMADAQTPLSPRERLDVVKGITEQWGEWETMTLTGKLKMPGLPLSPSVKIFMVKDSTVRISLRAPLMGEVGRAEIDTDSILVVNKMKKTYVKEPIDSIVRNYPIDISGLQSLLLGRVVLPGAGTLSEETAPLIELFPEQDGEYSLIPGEELELEEFNYGYLIDTESLPSALIIVPVDNPDINADITYEYLDKGYNMTFTYRSPKKIYGGALQLDYPLEGGSSIDLIKVNKKYTRLSFKQFMKSF